MDDVYLGNGASELIAMSMNALLDAGDEVLIINLQGASADYASAGNYEFKTIASISSNTLTLDSALRLTYGDSSTQKIMVQRVPRYTNVTVAAGATLTATAWDGTRNGVLMFKANGTVTINGTVSMTGKGFRGGSGASAYTSSPQGGETYNGRGGSGGAYNSNGSTGQGGGGGGGVVLLALAPRVAVVEAVEVVEEVK